MSRNYGTVIHYWNGMALCEDIYGDLFYVEINEEYAPIGSAVDYDDLTPIEALDADVEQSARVAVNAIPQDQLQWAREVCIGIS